MTTKLRQPKQENQTKATKVRKPNYNNQTKKTNTRKTQPNKGEPQLFYLKNVVMH